MREISKLVNRGERQVRIIRERLNDLRTDNTDQQPLSLGAR